MSDHHNVLSMAVVALVAVAGLVLFFAGSHTGAAAAYGRPGPLTEPQDHFNLGLQAGEECMSQDATTMHFDEWRMCCENKCTTEDKCLGQTYVWGVRVVNECSRTCNSGCREQIRRSTLIMPKTEQQ